MILKSSISVFVGGGKFCAALQYCQWQNLGGFREVASY